MDLPEYLEKREDKDQALYEVVRDTPTTLYEYGRLLLRRKGVLFIAAVFGTSVGLLISMPRTRIFQAHTMLEIQRLNENLLNTGEISPTANSSDRQNTGEYGLFPFSGQSRTYSRYRRVWHQALPGSESTELEFMERIRVGCWPNVLSMAFEFEVKPGLAI